MHHTRDRLLPFPGRDAIPHGFVTGLRFADIVVGIVLVGLFLRMIADLRRTPAESRHSNILGVKSYVVLVAATVVLNVERYHVGMTWTLILTTVGLGLGVAFAVTTMRAHPGGRTLLR